LNSEHHFYNHTVFTDFKDKMKFKILAFLLIVARAEAFGFFGSEPADNSLNSSSEKIDHHDPNSTKFHNVVSEILTIPVPSKDQKELNSTGSNVTDINAGNPHHVPQEAFEKLKESGQKAGLSPHKADRLDRAVKLMNMTANEIGDIQKVLSDNATTPDYAEKVRRSLEEVAIQQQTAPTKNELNKQVGNQDASSLNSTPVYTVEGGAALNATNATKVDPLTLHRLNVTSQLTGMAPHETAKFLRAIVESDMNATQADQLQQAIVHHGASGDDLNKLADALEKNKTRSANATSPDASPAQGHDQGNPAHAEILSNAVKNGSNSQEAKIEGGWENLPPVKSSGNGLENGTRFARNAVPYVFSADRRCGVSPKVLPKRQSNVSPGQYPWTVAILSSDDVFLCSGSLISSSIVLTTATCVNKYKKTGFAPKIILGAWNFPIRNDLSELPELEVHARAAILHPNYKEGSNANNLGLLRLTQDVDFDAYPHIFPICVISSSLIDPSTVTNQCKIQGWPNLADLNVDRGQAFMTGADVVSKSSGCPNNAAACINGPACAANEGSAVICPGKTGRFYQWGTVAINPKCSKHGQTIDLEAVSIVDNYSFISAYIQSPNPANNN